VVVVVEACMALLGGVESCVRQRATCHGTNACDR